MPYIVFDLAIPFIGFMGYLSGSFLLAFYSTPGREGRVMWPHIGGLLAILSLVFVMCYNKVNTFGLQWTLGETTEQLLSKLNHLVL
jgi:hypothetical protein